MIVPAPQAERFQGFYSNLFTVRKKEGLVHPIFGSKDAESPRTGPLIQYGVPLVAGGSFP